MELDMVTGKFSEVLPTTLDPKNMNAQDQSTAS